MKYEIDRNGHCEIPQGETSIGYCATENYANLVSITIPNSVTNIDDYAFTGCANLISVTIPSSVERIGNYAFWRCTNLSSVTVPDSVTRIGDFAFQSCANLKTIGRDMDIDGDLIGWKKCRDKVIVKLKIPSQAKRSHAIGRKCRCEFAIVEEVIGETEGVSEHDRKITYRVGETVYPDSFDHCRWNECANGIHFFLTKKEAKNY